MIDSKAILEKFMDEFSDLERRTETLSINLVLNRYLAKDTSGFKKGRRLTPEDIGRLAASGILTAEVFDKPQIGIISVGDELVSIVEKECPGKIRDSNSFLLGALLEELGCVRGSTYLIRDDVEILKNSLMDAIQKNDAIVFTKRSSEEGFLRAKEAVNFLGLPGVVGEDSAKGILASIIYDLNCACCTRKTPVFMIPGEENELLRSFNDLVKPAVLACYLSK